MSTTMIMAEPKVAILCAIKDELHAVEAALPGAASKGILILSCGMGWEAASHTAHGILDHHKDTLKAVFTTGYCGGLINGIPSGELVLGGTCAGLSYDTDLATLTKDSPQAPRAEDWRELGYGDWNQKISNALQGAGLSHRTGRVITARKAVIKTADKRAMGLATDAMSVDMETAAIAEAGREAGVPVFCLRAVSDTVTHELPTETSTFINPLGERNLGNVTRFLFKRPGNFTTLLTMKSNAGKASSSLTAAWKAMLPVLRELTA